MNIKEDFSKKLSKLLKDKEMSQTELANLIGMDRSNVNRWISAETLPTPKVMEKLSKILKVNIEYTFTNK